MVEQSSEVFSLWTQWYAIAGYAVAYLIVGLYTARLIYRTSIQGETKPDTTTAELLSLLFGIFLWPLLWAFVFFFCFFVIAAKLFRLMLKYKNEPTTEKKNSDVSRD